MEKITPMSAKVGTEENLDDKGMIFELKIDGIRCLCYKDSSNIMLLNRNGVWFHYKYPEVVIDLQRSILAEHAIIDGEIYVPDEKGRPNFHMLSRRDHLSDMAKVDTMSKEMPAVYAAFDILNKEGKNITSLPLLERKKILDETVIESTNTTRLYYTEDGRSIWKFVKESGLEGVMAKRKESSYLAGGRSSSWLKIKALRTMDVIILGYTTGTGSRKDLGSLLTGCYYKGKLVYTGMVGTGLSESEWQNLFVRLQELPEIKDPFNGKADIRIPSSRKVVWTGQRYVVEVRFMELTEQLILRASSILRLRDDKDPKECLLEDQVSGI